MGSRPGRWVGRKLGKRTCQLPHPTPHLLRTPRGEDVTGPPPGVTAMLKKDFFEGSLVKCQEEGVQETELPSPQA